jgi:Tol biopolymer transport system component
MTAFDRFDPFEQRITAAIDEIAAPRRPEYLDDILRQTARSSQRPRWTFPGRWVPMDLAVRMGPATRLPMRGLLLLALALLLAAAVGVAVVGSLNAVPSPFGLADNGLIGYPDDGDLFVRDPRTNETRLVIGTPDVEQGPWFSPDGRSFMFVRTTDGKDFMWVADANGSDERLLVPEPLVGANAFWAPDSRTIALLNETRGLPALSLVDMDGGPAREIDLGDANPTGDFAFRPPDGRQLLVRGQNPDSSIDLFLVDLATGDVRPLGLVSLLLLGPQWDNSGPAWSPDGTRIAYNRVEREPTALGVQFRVHLVNPDGTGDVVLPGPDDPNIMEAWPAWSPDGTQILVHRWTWKTNEGGLGWVALMPADGSAPARDIGPVVAGGEETGISKGWSPDGSRILIRYENTRQVYEIDPITGAETTIPWTEELPDWQRVKRWP